jgi:hypothetical protein
MVPNLQASVRQLLLALAVSESTVSRELYDKHRIQLYGRI